MSFDLRIQRTCEHLVFDERVTISGLSPDYFSILRYGSDGASNMVTVREFSRTEGLSEFIYRRDGFSNWELSADFKQVNWNSAGLGGPGTGVAGFLDGSSLVQPPQEMLVTYRTVAERCPLCLNVASLSKDVDFDTHGRLRTLEGTDKVRQQVFKALLTELGSNEVVAEYGSTLSASIGEKFDDLTRMRIYSAAQAAVDFLRVEQLSQPDLPLDETILAVSNMSVTQNRADPRAVDVFIEVQVGDFTKVPVKFNLVTST